MKEVNISIINDEISKDLAEAINFCVKNEIKYIDIRSISNRNILSLSEEETYEVKEALDKSNILVSGVSSPLFKWYQDNDRHNNNGVDLFHYKTSLSQKEKTTEIRKAFRYCQILESPTLRIFSGLMISSKPSPNFYQDERKLYDEVTVLSDEYSINVGLENEPKTNINSLSHLRNFRQLVPTDSFGLLLDIGNLYYLGEKLDETNLMELLDYTIPNYHIKEYSSEYDSYTELGKGDIPYRNLLRLILENIVHKQIFLTLEPHPAKGSYKEIENSILHLRYLLKDFNFINYSK